MIPLSILVFGYLFLGLLLSCATYLIGGTKSFWTFAFLFLLSFLPIGINLPFAAIHFGGMIMRWKLNLSFVATIAILIFGDQPMKKAGLMVILLCGIILVPILIASMIL